MALASPNCCGSLVEGHRGGRGLAVAHEVQPGGGVVLAGLELAVGQPGGRGCAERGQPDHRDGDERGACGDRAFRAAGHPPSRDHHRNQGGHPDEGGQADEAVAGAPQEGLDGDGAEQRGGEAVAAVGEGDERQEHQRGDGAGLAHGAATDADDGGHAAHPHQRYTAGP